MTILINPFQYRLTHGDLWIPRDLRTPPFGDTSKPMKHQCRSSSTSSAKMNRRVAGFSDEPPLFLEGKTQVLFYWSGWRVPVLTKIGWRFCWNQRSSVSGCSILRAFDAGDQAIDIHILSHIPFTLGTWCSRSYIFHWYIPLQFHF